MGAPTRATATHLVVVGELVGLHGIFGCQGGFHHAALADLLRVLLAAGRRGYGCGRDGVTQCAGPPPPPPQNAVPSPSHGKPTWGDMGTVQVAAQVTLQVVDGAAVPVAEGAAAGAITVTLGLGGLGDICGGDWGHAGAASCPGSAPQDTHVLLYWGDTLAPKPHRGHTEHPGGSPSVMLRRGDPLVPGMWGTPPVPRMMLRREDPWCPGYGVTPPV